MISYFIAAGLTVLLLTSNTALGYYSKVSTRYKEVKMLHIGLNSGFWHPLDIWFVITGRA